MEDMYYQGLINKYRKYLPVTDSTPKKGGRSRYSNKTYGNDSEKKKEEENQTGTFKPRRTRDNK